MANFTYTGYSVSNIITESDNFSYLLLAVDSSKGDRVNCINSVNELNTVMNITDKRQLELVTRLLSLKYNLYLIRVGSEEVVNNRTCIFITSDGYYYFDSSKTYTSDDMLPKDNANYTSYVIDFSNPNELFEEFTGLSTLPYLQISGQEQEGLTDKSLLTIKFTDQLGIDDLDRNRVERVSKDTIEIAAQDNLELNSEDYPDGELVLEGDLLELNSQYDFIDDLVDAINNSSLIVRAERSGDKIIVSGDLNFNYSTNISKLKIYQDNNLIDESKYLRHLDEAGIKFISKMNCNDDSIRVKISYFRDNVIIQPYSYVNGEIVSMEYFEGKIDSDKVINLINSNSKLVTAQLVNTDVIPDIKKGDYTLKHILGTNITIADYIDSLDYIIEEKDDFYQIDFLLDSTIYDESYDNKLIETAKELNSLALIGDYEHSNLSMDGCVYFHPNYMTNGFEMPSYMLFLDLYSQGNYSGELDRNLNLVSSKLSDYLINSAKVYYHDYEYLLDTPYYYYNKEYLSIYYYIARISISKYVNNYCDNVISNYTFDSEDLVKSLMTRYSNFITNASISNIVQDNRSLAFELIVNINNEYVFSYEFSFNLSIIE